MKNDAAVVNAVVWACILLLGCSTRLPETGPDSRSGDMGEEELEVFQECVLPPMEKLVEDEGSYSYDEPPELIKYESPRYPKYYRDNGIEGTVLLRVEIDKNGDVKFARIIQSDLPETLECWAVHAAMNFKFKPARIRGDKVNSATAIPIRFILHR